MNLADHGLRPGVPSAAQGLTGDAGGPFSQWAYPVHVCTFSAARAAWLAVTWCTQRTGWLVRMPGSLGGDGQPSWSWAGGQTSEMAHPLLRVDVRIAVGGWRLLRLYPLPSGGVTEQPPRWVLLSRSDIPSAWQQVLCTLHLHGRLAGGTFGGSTPVATQF